jgi:pilus assembly protein CpaB
MARIRVFIVLVLALAAGGTFAFGTYQYMQNMPTRTVRVQTTPVMVAAADLDIGTELRREDLRAIEWPADGVPEGAFTSADELLGRGLVQPITQNEAFLPAKLAPKEAGTGLPPAIPPGFRAVSVRVNDVIGVAGYVLPGTRVDVVATVNPTQQPPDVTSKVVLTNVQVLAAGTKIERGGENQDKPVAVSVVTLLVSPEEAERLTLASTEGKIQLALRNPLDKTAPPTPGIQPAVLVGPGLASRRPGAGRSAAAAPVTAEARVEPAPTVEIIRGDKRAVEVVRQE